MLLINFKNYEQSFGEFGLKIAKMAEEVHDELGVEIGIVPNFLDLRTILGKVHIPIFAQHADPFEPGSHTGSVLPSFLRNLGVNGVVLNHAEKRLRLDVLKDTFLLAKRYGLKTVVCADDEYSSKMVAALNPDYVAIEPPELIGGDVSVVTKPEFVRKGIESVKSISNSKVLVGAGIKSGEDVKKAIELGADGVFVASAICKASDPKSKILELAGGFR